jgi:hypothetical protein
LRAAARPVISPPSTRPSPSVAPVYGPAGRSRPSLYSGHVAGASRVRHVRLNEIAVVESAFVGEFRAGGVGASILDPLKPGSSILRLRNVATGPQRLLVPVGMDPPPLAPIVGATASVALELLADESARPPAGREQLAGVVANHDVGIVVQRPGSIYLLILGRNGRSG